MEFFVAAYSGNDYEGFTFINRAFGPYWWAYWIMVSCNVITPQLFWFRKIRTSVPASFILSILREHRHVVRALRHHRDLAAPRRAGLELGLLRAGRPRSSSSLGTFGLFFFLFLLFVRFFPVIAMTEVKGVMPQANPHWEGYERGPRRTGCAEGH